MRFGLCSLEPGEKYQGQYFLEWMLEEAYRENPSFSPRAYMLDKDGNEHKTVENAIMHRAKDVLQAFVTSLRSQCTSLVNTSRCERALQHVNSMREKVRELEAVATLRG